MQQVDIQISGERLLIPRGTQLLVVGPPGISKTKLALEIAAAVAQDGMKSAYATTVVAPERIRRLVSSIAPGAEGKIEIIDGVACIAGKTSSEKLSFKSLSELNSVSMTLLGAIQDANGGVCCLDNLSTLLIYSDTKAVLKFVQVVSAKWKSQGIIGIFILEEGMHERELESLLAFILDGSIQIAESEHSGTLEYRRRVEFVRGKLVDSRWKQLS